MVNLVLLLLCSLLLAGCGTGQENTETLAQTQPSVTAAESSAPVETEPADPVARILASMPLEDWVGQLFLVGVDTDIVDRQIQEYQVGGFLLFSRDFDQETKESMTEKLSVYQANAKIPLLIAVDEEGGTVARVSTFSAFRAKKFLSPRVLYDQGRMEWVLSQEAEKCRLLTSLGINVNLGPVCDITTDPYAFMYQRSLGQDAETTAGYVTDIVHQMQSFSLGSCLKHFPGYGNNTDTHTGIARDRRSLAALEGKDLIPFQAGIDAGCGSILVSHIIVEALDPEYPASLSPSVHSYLREQMGFDGVIITDDMTMKAITNRYGAGEAAVMALLAGNDLLCSSSFTEQYEAVMAAVLEGRIDFDTLKNAVTRVLTWKVQLGLIQP